MYTILLIISILIFIYLMYVLVRPENSDGRATEKFR